MAFDDPVRNAHPQAGIGHSFRGKKGIKNPSLDLIGHADSRIGDFELHVRPTRPVIPELDGQFHPSCFSKFDRIPHQIEQDLPEPRRIAEDRLGDRSLEFEEQRQFLGVSPHAHDRHHVGGQLHRRDWQEFDLQPSRFDLRKIENPIDDFQQVLAVAQHGLDRGAAFDISIPAVAAPPDSAEPIESPPVPGGSETVLVVEDEQGIRGLLGEILGGRGYRVLSASRGQEAVDMLARAGEPVHLLVTDVVMPGMNGRELAERLRLKIPGLKVLYISGYTPEEVTRRGVPATDSAFLQKPFSAAVLLRTVREVLDGS